MKAKKQIYPIEMPIDCLHELKFFGPSLDPTISEMSLRLIEVDHKAVIFVFVNEFLGNL